MEAIKLIKKYDLFLAPNFFDESTCRKIINETRSGVSGPATVYGQIESGAVDQRVRRASRVNPTEATIGYLKQRLLDFKTTVEQHFQLSLVDCEEPQFVRYDIGDFFVAHQDGNTGLIRLKSDAERKISIVIFLNRQTSEPMPDSYCGGSLRFSDYRAEEQYKEFSLPVETGLLVAFRAETTHEVTPVTAGERYSIVSWYR